MKENIGIIGYGNMGSAIGQRLKSKFQVWAFDKDKGKTENLSDIKIAGDILNLISAVIAVILSVKPQDFGEVLKEIKNDIDAKLVISIAAGISTGYIESRLGRVRVIRVMPNLPAKVGKGMICLCKGNFASEKDLDFAKELFDNLGETMLVEENLMNAVTAVSGSGPGYFYHLIQGKKKEEWEDYGRDVFVPKLSEAARGIGFNLAQAQLLAARTVEGSIALLEETGISPAELCRQVTSKGGTTEAGLRVLRGIDSLADTVSAALKRAEELSRS
jgi:pyrroline-5-carboxylate reductase